MRDLVLGAAAGLTTAWILRLRGDVGSPPAEAPGPAAAAGAAEALVAAAAAAASAFLRFASLAACSFKRNAALRAFFDAAADDDVGVETDDTG